MVSVKYVCKKCHHVEYMSVRQHVMTFIWALLSLLGICFLLFLFILGPNIMVSGVLDTFGTYYARTNSNEIRYQALNITTYSGDDSFKWALDLAQNIGDMRYVPANPYRLIQVPKETWLYGGDCKNTAILYTSMLNTLKVKAAVDCSTEHKHCVTRIDKEDYYMTVDFAGGYWAIYEACVNSWETPQYYVAYGLIAYKEPLAAVEENYYDKLTMCHDSEEGFKECYKTSYCAQ